MTLNGIGRQFFWAAIPLLMFHASCSRKNDKKAADNSKRPEIIINGNDLSRLENGDILLKRGYGPVSNLIVKNFREKIPLSHCGVYVKFPDSSCVVHSVTESYGHRNGVQTLPFDLFIKDCRPGSFYAVRLKKPADIRNKFAAQAYLFTQQEIPFDEQINNEDRHAMYCTELIHWCMMDVLDTSYLTGIPFYRKRLFSFNAMLDTAKFKIVFHY